MRFLTSLCVVALWAAPVFSQATDPKPEVVPTPDPKTEAVKLRVGAYFWTGSTWQPLQKTAQAGGGLKHVGKMFVPGLTPQMVWTFRDAQAPVQVADGKPLLCFKFMPGLENTPYAPSGRDLAVIKFDEKKDHRELQTSSGGNVFTFKSGISKERMPDIEWTGLDHETFIVTPKEPLKPGEYLLTCSSLGMSGYDFGFHEAKQK